MNRWTLPRQIDGHLLVALLLTIWGASGVAYALIRIVTVWQHNWLGVNYFLISQGLSHALSLVSLVVGIALLRQASWSRRAAVIVLYLEIARGTLALCVIPIIMLWHPRLFTSRFVDFDAADLIRSGVSLLTSIAINLALIFFIRHLDAETPGPAGVPPAPGEHA